MTVLGTGAVSVLYALGDAGVPLGGLGVLLHRLPLYKMGFGWLGVAAGMLALSLLLGVLCKPKETPAVLDCQV